MRRVFLALVGAIALMFVASIIAVERWTRPGPTASASGPPASSLPAAAPRQEAAPSPPLAVPPSPPPVRAPQVASTGLPRIPVAPLPPVAARAAKPERAREPAPVPGAARLALSFKLDSALTKGLHMGARWVSPPTYTATGSLKNVTIEAKARSVGRGQERSRAKTAWTASEPDMVEVSPEEGDQVKLTVWRSGESRVTVHAGGVSRAVTVKATEVQGRLRVDIVQ